MKKGRKASRHKFSIGIFSLFVPFLVSLLYQFANCDESLFACVRILFGISPENLNKSIFGLFSERRRIFIYDRYVDRCSLIMETSRQYKMNQESGPSG